MAEIASRGACRMSAVHAETPVVLEHAGAGTDGDQYADPTAIVLDVDSILIADRYRKDLGDLTDLKRSIVNVGILNPVTVTEYYGGYKLLAGERRLTAFKELGLAQIPARVAREIGDAHDALVAERDENTARKPMLLSETTALGLAIEAMERPAAQGRMTSGHPGLPGTQGRTREIAADAIGMSHATYTRMKNLVETAADETAPEEVREAARGAVEAIDQGAPVRNGYDKVKAVRLNAEAAARDKRATDAADYVLALAALHPTLRIAFEKDGHTKYASVETLGQAANRAGATWRYTEKQWQSRVFTSTDVLTRSSLAVETALDAIDVRVDMTTITPEQATEALERLNASALNRIIRQLKEISNG